MKHLLMAVCLVTALASGATAQPAPAPSFAVGDSWTYTDGRQIKVVKIEDGGAVMTGGLRGLSGVRGAL